MSYCDDDREYIRPPKRAKTETFCVSTTPSQPKMNIFKKTLSSDKDVYASEQGNHTVYIMPFETFMGLPIDTWKHNRPPDEKRVHQIREWVDTSKRIQGTIHLACVDNKLVCYDANHRREALKGLSLIYPVTVDIVWDATDEDVKQEFVRLNQAVSVPELYVTHNPIVTEAELRPIVTVFCATHGSHYVTTKHPQRPNFSRDGITDQFYRLCEELQIKPDELKVRINRLNSELAAKDKTGLSAKIIEKCTKSGLWLFAWSTQISKDLV